LQFRQELKKRYLTNGACFKIEAVMHLAASRRLCLEKLVRNIHKRFQPLCVQNPHGYCVQQLFKRGLVTRAQLGFRQNGCH
jgi:hypothetical protein